MNIEVKKHALRQTQDGEWHLTVKMHPNDPIDHILKASMGARFYTGEWIEVDDNEQPVERAAGSQVITPAAPAAPEPEPPGRSKVAPDKRLVQQAGILCDDIRFQRFLREIGWGISDPAVAVRKICEVDSRSEIVPGTPAGRKFEMLLGQFEHWKAA